MLSSVAQTQLKGQTESEGLSDFQQAVYDGLLRDDPKAADRYSRCGNLLEWVGYCEDCETTRPDFHAYQVSTHCMLRICYNCGDVIAAPIRDRYRPLLEYVFAHMLKGWSVKHVVLTRSVGLSEDAGENAVQTMDFALKLADRLFLRFKGAGIIATSEAGETGGKWHVHMIVYSPYVPQQIISDVWKEITGGDFIVYIRRLKDADAAISEGLKYVTKFVNLSPDQLVSLHFALKGTRRIRARGFFFIGKNHPLRDMIKALRHETKGCPDCGRKRRYTRPDEFLKLSALRMMIDASTVEKAIAGLEELRRVLNLKEAINFSERGPP